LGEREDTSLQIHPKVNVKKRKRKSQTGRPNQEKEGNKK